MNEKTILCKPEEFNAYIYRKCEVLEAIVIYLIKRLSQIDRDTENDALHYLSQIEHKNPDVEFFSKLIHELAGKIKITDIK
ncbi:hypothetical protein E0G79_26320 [Salmonella enterica]|nr:hypothetical protein [Salmonella enterica]EGX5144530.1 hypothetical protein [Salmonella enterica]ELF4900458.1 hypothetical protein [Salmonella enterica]